MDNSRPKYQKLIVFGGNIRFFGGRGIFPLWMPRINTAWSGLGVELTGLGLEE